MPSNHYNNNNHDNDNNNTPTSHKNSIRLILIGCIVVLMLNFIYVIRQLLSGCTNSMFFSSNNQISTSSVKFKTTIASNNRPHPLANAPRNPANSMAACLLIKDDNDIIEEWLAYHYHAWNLRYLIVAIDPTSETSPRDIFQKWRDYTRLEIVEWGDENFMPSNTTEFFDLLKKSNWTEQVLGLNATTTMFHNGDEDVETVRQDVKHIRSYIYRQNAFLSACLREMKRVGKMWTFLLDTDEYIVLNKELRNAEEQPVFMTQMGDSFEKPSCLFDILMEFVWWSRKRINYPCIPMPSLKYGGVENTGEEPDVAFPRGVLDIDKFETLRWTHHIDENDDERNGPQKVIIDVQQIPDDDQMFGPIVQSVHRPSLHICQDVDTFFDYGKYPFSLNHYLGSWERFSSRKSDPRRKSKTRYDYLNADGSFTGQDTWIRSWVDGFVRAQGIARATKLLDHYLLDDKNQR